MKIRFLKHVHLAAMFASGRLVPSALGIGHYLPAAGEVLTVVDQSSMSGLNLPLLSQAISGGPVLAETWRVARAKDNVIVLEANSREEALAAIDKAARQKKAKLVLLDGEPFQVEV